MKVYKGIVKGNTVILEEKPDLPDECPAFVEIKPIDQARDEAIARRQFALLKNFHKGGNFCTAGERNFMTGGEKLLATNVLVHAYTGCDERKGRSSSRYYGET
jgi:hypothetical protein